MKKAFFILVRGRVQGVGFRYSAVREARQLKITGWVRNNEDGDVEVWAEGREEELEAFLRWLGRGPQYARVDSLEQKEKSPEGYKSFDLDY